MDTQRQAADFRLLQSETALIIAQSQNVLHLYHEEKARAARMWQTFHQGLQQARENLNACRAITVSNGNGCIGPVRPHQN